MCEGTAPGRLRVVMAPDSFKGTATAPDAARALARGWARSRPDDAVVRLPLADGGEGTLDALGADLPASCRRSATVSGPTGSPVRAEWLVRPDGTAVVELARAAGLHLSAGDDAAARSASTSGVGEMLRHATGEPGVTRVLLTLGGSATTDGGTGALAALGAVFLDAAGRRLPPGGGALATLDRVELDRLAAAPPGGLECLVDVTSPLLGPDGAAAVFGPQKGAGPEGVAALEEGLRRLARVLAGTAPHPVGVDVEGVGAAGGTAFGLLSCWPGRLVGGARAVAETVGFAEHLREADLVVTGEGRFDDQSTRGKVVGTVLADAARSGVAVAVVAGAVDPPAPPGVRTIDLSRLAGSGEAARTDPLRWLDEAAASLAAWWPDAPDAESVPSGT